MVRGNKTGNYTPEQIAPLFFELVQKMNRQTTDLILEKTYKRDPDLIKEHSKKVKLTAEEIIDLYRK